MKVCFVGGVDTGVGKTHITRQIIQALQNQSIKAIAIKPIETGILSGDAHLGSCVGDLGSSDSLMHLFDAQKILPHLTLRDINPYAFSKPAAPFVADERGSIDLESLFAHIEKFEDEVDVLLIEGAGGLWSPIKKDFFMISFALELQKRFDACTLIVCDDALGMIHRFLSAKFTADSLGLEYLMFVNLRESHQFREISLPFMRDYSFEMEAQDLIKVMRWI